MGSLRNAPRIKVPPSILKRRTLTALQYLFDHFLGLSNRETVKMARVEKTVITSNMQMGENSDCSDGYRLSFPLPTNKRN